MNWIKKILGLKTEKQCAIHIVSERLLICSRCNTEYRTESKEPYVGCCIMPVEHRTSGICGGELIERI